MKKIFTILVSICIPAMLWGQIAITQWPFDVDGDLSSNNAVGQDAVLIGGTTEVPQDDALRVTDFPDQYEASGTAGIELMASTEGFENILLEYKGRTSGTMSRWAEIQYTLDGGDTWLVLTNNQGGLFPRDEWLDFSFNFGQIAGANDNPDFGIRIVSIFSPVAFEDGLGSSFVADTAYHRARDEGGGEYSGGGNWRFQDVTLKGSVPLNRIPITQWPFDVDGDLGSDNAVGQDAVLIGGTTEVSQDDALRVTDFPEQYQESGTAGIELMASTVGFDNILLEYKGRTSGTMSRWAEIQYTLDGGDTWLVLTDNQGGLFPRDIFLDFTFDFGDISGANDNPDFGIRIVSIFSPVAFEDGLGSSFAADTAYHRARDDGGGEYSGGGNWRFQEVTLLGVQQTGAEATKLSFVSVNDNNPVYAGEEFSITVQVLDADDLPVDVTEDLTFTISLEAGTGNLSGDQTGSIEAGNSSVTLTGFIYDVVESGVVIKVEADNLDAGFSDAFDVLLRTYTLTLNSNIAVAGALTGAGDYIAGDEVTIEAIANEGFAFVNWTLDGVEFAATSEYTFEMPEENLTLTANFEEIYTGGPMLVHYWHFNTMDGSAVTEVISDFSASGMSANITYPGTGAGYMDARTHRPADPVSNFNLRLGQEPNQGAVLRVRNPADTRELLFEIPSTGYHSLIVTYAATRSDNGGTHQRFEYSADGGTTWVTFGDDIEIPFIGEGDDVGQYAHIILDLSEIEEINDNPDLYFRILSVGEGNNNPTGNQRIDNFTLDGVPILGGEPAMLAISSVNNGDDVYVDEEFSVLVHVFDSQGLPAVVTESITVTLSVESGTGTLGGNTSGIIEEGSTFVEITGITYDVAETAVVIRAEAVGLDAALSDTFDVLERTYVLTLTSNIPGAGVLTGAGTYTAGQSVTIEAVANEGYDFINWTLDGVEFAATSEYTFEMPDTELTLVANFEEVYTGGPMLIHYWHFNNLLNNVEVTLVNADYSAGGLSANITYPGTGPGYMDGRTHNAGNPVSNFNLRLGQEPDQGAVLRVRNPANTRELLFEIPSTGYQNLVVTYAATRTENGGTLQRFEYSPDAGSTWVTFGDDIEIPFIGEGEDIGQYAHIILDLSEIEEINDNPDLHFRILSVGEGNDNPSGNQRIDNFTLDGVPILGGEPAMLAISSVNSGDDVYVNEEFSLLVQVFDSEGLPATVTENITVTLSVETGTGVLGGNTTGIIEEGTTFVEITGITYDAAEAAVVIKAEADGLAAALSDAFDVLERSYVLTLSSNIPGAGVLTGAGTYTAGQAVTIEAVANEGYEFAEWLLDGDEFSSNPVHTFTMPDRNLEITAYFVEVFMGDPVLVHYWHFNTLTGETVTEVNSDYSAAGLSANITYPGTGDGYMDGRTHREADPVSNFNLRQGQEPDQGAVLRVRNPADTRVLLFEIPSIGYQNLVVTYATTRSENGGQQQRFEYSPDGGSTWITVGDDIDVPFIGELGVDEEVGVYAHVVIDLTDVAAVNDNPNLFFRILSVGEGNDNPTGNQRFDNFSVDGVPLGEVGVIEAGNLLPQILVHPNPASNRVNITLTEPGAVISIYNINGMLVMQERAEQKTLSIDTEHLKSGLYIIRGIYPSTGKTVSEKLIIR
jgi:hypothetical protein